jgi:hypothetical protein
VTGNQEEQNRGQELRQAHEAKVERPPGSFVNLPADCHGLHLRGENDAEARYLEQSKILEAEDGDAGPWIFWLGHSNYFATK